MAELHVNPTRMELKKLQARYAVARRGHKLLKDKRDELMRTFLAVAKESKLLRAELEGTLAAANRKFAMASAAANPRMLETALLLPKKEIALKVRLVSRMSVTVPEFTLQGTEKGETANYGFAFTSGELDGAIEAFGDLLPRLLHLAQLEKEATLLAEEIERTRRRVNALEHIMIPRYLEAMKSIKMRLDENERGNLTRLMKVKDMMLQQTLSEKYSFFPDGE